jgi:hypothetical protein
VENICHVNLISIVRQEDNQFNLNYHDGIFEVTPSGDATLQGYYDFTKAILEHEEWKPGGLILINITELNTGPLSIGDVKAIAGISGLNSEQIGKAKVAIAVSRDLEYGMSRMWQIFVQQDAVWYASEKIFKNRDEAVTWLQSV